MKPVVRSQLHFRLGSIVSARAVRALSSQELVVRPAGGLATIGC